MGEVIHIGSYRKSELASSYEEVRMEGFRRALKALDALKGCSMRETIVAIENWVASDCGLLTNAEASELFAFHGWRRE
jgi:hypothetical protein